MPQTPNAKDSLEVARTGSVNYKKPFKSGGNVITLSNFKYDPTIDYMSEYDKLPLEVSQLIHSEKYTNDDEWDNDYKELLSELEKIGWTFEYDMSGGYHSLRPIGQPEPEFKAGGKIQDFRSSLRDYIDLLTDWEIDLDGEEETLIASTRSELEDALELDDFEMIEEVNRIQDEMKEWNSSVSKANLPGWKDADKRLKTVVQKFKSGGSIDNTLFIDKGWGYLHSLTGIELRKEYDAGEYMDGEVLKEDMYTVISPSGFDLTGDYMPLSQAKISTKDYYTDIKEEIESGFNTYLKSDNVIKKADGKYYNQESQYSIPYTKQELRNLYNKDYTAHLFKNGGEIPSDVDMSEEFSELEQYGIFARKDDHTKKGINEGFVFGHSDLIFGNEKDALAYVKKHGYKTLQESYDDEFHYWSDWYQDSPSGEQGYYTEKGDFVEVMKAGGNVKDPLVILEFAELTPKETTSLMDYLSKNKKNYKHFFSSKDSVFLDVLDSEYDKVYKEIESKVFKVDSIVDKMALSKNEQINNDDNMKARKVKKGEIRNGWLYFPLGEIDYPKEQKSIKVGDTVNYVFHSTYSEKYNPKDSRVLLGSKYKVVSIEGKSPNRIWRTELVEGSKYPTLKDFTKEGEKAEFSLVKSDLIKPYGSTYAEGGEIGVLDERSVGKMKIIMLQKDNTTKSITFKDGVENRFNRNNQQDLNLLWDLANKIPYGTVIDKKYNFEKGGKLPKHNQKLDIKYQSKEPWEQNRKTPAKEHPRTKDKVSDYLKRGDEVRTLKEQRDQATYRLINIQEIAMRQNNPSADMKKIQEVSDLSNPIGAEWKTSMEEFKKGGKLPKHNQKLDIKYQSKEPWEQNRKTPAKKHPRSKKDIADYLKRGGGVESGTVITDGSWILVDKDTKKPIKVGDKRKTSRDQDYFVTHGSAPRTTASTGRVYDDPYAHGYFPGVINAMWIEKK
jgi:hypothetical protein